MIDVDPKNPNRLFVAALGHPYGPNAERGIFRSTDGGKTFQKVYTRTSTRAATTSASIRAIRTPSTPTLWQQQQSYIEGGAFGGAGGGIFKSTDGGTTWKQLTEGLPTVIQANIALAHEQSAACCTRWWRATPATAGGRGGGSARATVVGSTSRRTAASTGRSIGRRRRQPGAARGHASARAHRRRRSADARRRSEERERRLQLRRRCSGEPRTAASRGRAVRGAPGGDDYQKTWINPNNSEHHHRRQRSGRRRLGESRRVVEQLVHAADGGDVPRHRPTTRSPTRVCSGQQDSGSACVAEPVDGRRDHVPRLASGEHPGVRHRRARSEATRTWCYGSARNNVSLYNRKTGQTTHVGPDMHGRLPTAARSIATCARCRSSGRRSIRTCCSTCRTSVWKTTDRGAQLDAHQPAISRGRRGRCRRTPASTRAP